MAQVCGGCLGDTAEGSGASPAREEGMPAGEGKCL